MVIASASRRPYRPPLPRRAHQPVQLLRRQILPLPAVLPVAPPPRWQAVAVDRNCSQCSGWHVPFPSRKRQGLPRPRLSYCRHSKYFTNSFTSTPPGQASFIGPTPIRVRPSRRMPPSRPAPYVLQPTPGSARGPHRRRGRRRMAFDRHHRRGQPEDRTGDVVDLELPTGAA